MPTTLPSSLETSGLEPTTGIIPAVVAVCQKCNVLRSSFGHTFIHNTYHPCVWWRFFAGRSRTMLEAPYPQRNTDLSKRGKGERPTEMVVVSRFIVHHAARDCASVSRRAILGDTLFHNAAGTERIMKVISIFTMLYS